MSQCQIVTLLKRRQDIYQRNLSPTRRRSKIPLPSRQQERHRQSHCFANSLLLELAILYYETNCSQLKRMLCRLPQAVELEPPLELTCDINYYNTLTPTVAT